MNITTHGDKPKINFLSAEKRALEKALKIVTAVSNQPGFPDYCQPALEALSGLSALVKLAGESK